MGSNPIQLLGMGVFTLLFVALPTAAGAYAIYQLGHRIAELPFLLTAARGVTSVGWIGLTVMLATRTVGKTGRIDHETGMLTTVPPRDVVGGLLLAELLRILSIVTIPVLTLSVTWSVVLGTPIPFVAVPLTALMFLVSALLTGHLLGVLCKTVFARSELLARYKTVVFLLLFAGYMGLVLSDAFGRALARLGTLLQDVPLAWFGDVLLLGVPDAGISLARVVGAVVLVAIAAPLLLRLDMRTAIGLWYADAVKPDAKERSSTLSAVATGLHSGDDGFLRTVASRPTCAVSANVWRRTMRAPIRLIYVVYPLFLLTGSIQSIVSTGVPAAFPFLMALYGTWAIGATALNPFGDEGTMLPLTLTSTIRGEQFVRGYALAPILVGLPVVVVVTAITGVVSPLELTETLALTAASVGLGIVGTVVAIGVGTVFPRFGEVRVTRSRRVVVPSKTAFVVYSIVIVLGFGGAAVAAVPAGAAMVSTMVEFWSTVLWHPIAIPVGTVRLVGSAMAVVLGVVAPVITYRYTVRRFETYTFDEASGFRTSLRDWLPFGF